jgi:acyl-CoA thioesterase
VRIERSGRSMSALSARLEQNGRLIALALASFGHTRARIEFQERAMPTVTPPEDVTARLQAGGKEVPLRARFEMRPLYDVLVGGWMRFAEPQVPDAAALAMFCDSWPPAISRRTSFGPDGIRGVPTIDLTIHFRAALPATARPDDFYLCSFRTRSAREGFLEEDGEIWTRDGLLLAQSRQLALLV